VSEILLDLGSDPRKNGTQFQANSDVRCPLSALCFEYRLSGSSTALGMARTFKALRKRSAFFFVPQFGRRKFIVRVHVQA
jgi:hypothetical protein